MTTIDQSRIENGVLNAFSDYTGMGYEYVSLDSHFPGDVPDTDCAGSHEFLTYLNIETGVAIPSRQKAAATEDLTKSEIAPPKAEQILSLADLEGGKTLREIAQLVASKLEAA